MNKFVESLLKILLVLITILFVIRILIYKYAVTPKIGITTNITLLCEDYGDFVDDKNETQSIKIKQQEAPNIDGHFSNSKKIDNYLDTISTCSDIYSKVCSLIDDPFKSTNKSITDYDNIDDENFDEAEYTTGTFQDMIIANKDAIDSITKHNNQYFKCINFYSNKNEAINNTYVFYKTFTTKEKINSLFDIWLHGGTSLFKITQKSKVLNDTLYSVDFDLDFGLFFNIFEPIIRNKNNVFTWLLNQQHYNDVNSNSFIKILSKYYSFFNPASYPTNLTDFVSLYTKISDIEKKYRNIRHVLINVMNMSEDDLVTFNGQYDFFEECFKEDKTMRKFYSILMGFQNLLLFFDQQSLKFTYDDGLVKTTQNLIENNISYKLIQNRNKMYRKMRKPNKISPLKGGKMISSFTSGQTISQYCSKMIRKVFFNTINHKYLILSNAFEHSKSIYNIVDRVLGMSQLFFSGNTSNEWFTSDEMKLRVAPDMAAFSLDKMNNVKIISLASIDKIFSEEMAKNEIDQLNTVLNQSWLALLNKGLGNKKTECLSIISNTRSTDYLKNRNNETYHLSEQWLMVKAETVNAWYDPTTNFITIPIGITRYPMFRGDNLYDYAFLGSVVGHELGHATDYNGRTFDKYGSWIGINNQHSEITDDAMINNIKCLINDYGKACGNENYGQHTLGEDMADQFGLRMVLSIINYDLVQYNGITNDYEFKEELKLQKKTTHRELFINFAKVWCGRSTYHQECTNVMSDVHAIPRHRVIKTMRQFESFKTAFACKDTDDMVNVNRCIIY